MTNQQQHPIKPQKTKNHLKDPPPAEEEAGDYIGTELAPQPPPRKPRRGGET